MLTKHSQKRNYTLIYNTNQGSCQQLLINEHSRNILTPGFCRLCEWVRRFYIIVSRTGKTQHLLSVMNVRFDEYAMMKSGHSTVEVELETETVGLQ